MMFGRAHYERRRIRHLRLPFHCTSCGYGSYTLKRLLSHIGLWHQHDPNFLVTCNIGGCSQGFIKFSTYRNHLYRKHRPLLDNQQEGDRLIEAPHEHEHEEVNVGNEADFQADDDMLEDNLGNEADFQAEDDMLEDNLAVDDPEAPCGSNSKAPCFVHVKN